MFFCAYSFLADTQPEHLLCRLHTARQTEALSRALTNYAAWWRPARADWDLLPSSSSSTSVSSSNANAEQQQVKDLKFVWKSILSVAEEREQRVAVDSLRQEVARSREKITGKKKQNANNYTHTILALNFSKLHIT